MRMAVGEVWKMLTSSRSAILHTLASVGIGRNTFVDDAGGGQGQRSIDNKRVTGNPADVGHAPVHIFGMDVLNVFGAARHIGEIAAGAVLTAFAAFRCCRWCTSGTAAPRHPWEREPRFHPSSWGGSRQRRNHARPRRAQRTHSGPRDASRPGPCPRSWPSCLAMLSAISAPALWSSSLPLR